MIGVLSRSSGLDEQDWQPPAPRPLATQHLWVPGDFPSNNEMIGVARHDGFAAGLHYYERHTKRRRAAPPPNDYNKRARAIRATVAARALRDLKPLPPERWCRLAFYLIGHPRYDPDAWYLAAKHATDGLQDAGIVGRDGVGVHSTEGRCVRSKEEATALLERAGVFSTAAPGGLLIEVSPWG